MVSGENGVFNVSKNIGYALSGTFYGIEKSFQVVEIWIVKVGMVLEIISKCIGKYIGNLGHYCAILGNCCTITVKKRAKSKQSRKKSKIWLRAIFAYS